MKVINFLEKTSHFSLKLFFCHSDKTQFHMVKGIIYLLSAKKIYFKYCNGLKVLMNVVCCSRDWRSNPLGAYSVDG